jgi:hypothetical protein
MSDVQTQMEETAPPVIETETVDPDVVGSLEPTEVAALNSLRQRSRQLVFDLGNMELRKLHMISQIEALEQQAQSVVDQASKRLGIVEGQQWTLLADGKVKVIRPPQG